MNTMRSKGGPDLSTSNGLAVQRTRFAGERTLMAWVRTAFSMITFGFSLVKFFQYLRTEKNVGADTGVHYLGLVMIVVGIAAIVIGTQEHWGLLKSLNEVDGSKRTTPALYIALVVGLLGLVALATAMVRTRSG